MSISEPLARHLGIPPGGALEGTALESFEEARRCFDAHCRLWSSVTLRGIQALGEETVDLSNGARLTSRELAACLAREGAHEVILVAVSAGRELDAAIDRAWSDGRPDLALFLDALGATAVETERDEIALRLAESRAASATRVLPRSGPGYDGWRIEDLEPLMGCLEDRGPLVLLPGGGLSPKKSTLVLHGLTNRTAAVPSTPPPSVPRGVPTAAWSFPEKALARWSRELLSVKPEAPGQVLATFRFEGKTCTSLNRPFELDYQVRLSLEAPAEPRITWCGVRRREGDSGFRWTCAFREGPEAFLAAVAEPPPLVGEPLAAALAWSPLVGPAACLCTPANRNHKWKIVLETVLFAHLRGELTEKRT